MSGKVECVLVCLVVLAVFHGGHGVPTETRSELTELLATRAPKTCGAVVTNDKIVKRLPNAGYALSFKGFTKRVARVIIKLSGREIEVKIDARYDENGRFLRRSVDYSKITHLIKGYRFGFHSDCERIPISGNKSTVRKQLSFGEVRQYPNMLKFVVKMKDIPASELGDCCFPCFVGEVDMIDVETEHVRIVRAVTSEKCERRTGGDRICSLGTICKNVIYGTDGDDVIRGTDGKDYIYALGGDDKVLGLGGDDVIFGGNGNDVLKGGDGRDYLYGEDGDDQLSGGNDGDRIEGGSGWDQSSGGPGDDFFFDTSRDYNLFYGDAGEDVFWMTGKGHGGRDDDKFFSRGGFYIGDVMFGGDGDDYFNSGGNDLKQDRIYGGRGDDIFYGHTFTNGDDILDGGPGLDYYMETWADVLRTG